MMFVYQEFDMLRETVKVPEERLEKVEIANRGGEFFANKLQEARIKQRLTIAEVASKVGISPRMMSLFENGSETPTDALIEAINSVLKFE